MKLFRKKVTIPNANFIEDLETIQLWGVMWTVRHGTFSFETREKFKVFASEESAFKFKKALQNAFKLIEHTSGNTVFLKKL